jgi:WD40 repeat protein
MRTIRLCVQALLLLLTTALANAGEPPKEPMLRIETGRHTGAIHRIALDAAGRWLVTASSDKSLRVWELPEGGLVRTIRPPSGEGYEGRLFSVAITPDGNTIACGGWTQGNGGQAATQGDGFTIYLFNRASGTLIGRVSELPGVINQLAFSPDGRYLACSLGGNNGIRLYRSFDWSPAGEDKDYGGSSYSAHFSRDNRLVTTCEDGLVRLYETAGGTLQLSAREKAPGGGDPYAARFSPDGSRVAVGYEDTANVSVLSGRDLSLLFSADADTVPNGNLRSVSWSADGRQLLAGGSSRAKFDDLWKNAIRRWSDGGRGDYTDSAASDNTLFDLAPLADGRIAYGASDPAFGLFDQSGNRALFVPPATADFRNLNQNFRVSSDGAWVNFCYETAGKSPATFNLVTRSLTQDGSTAFLQPALTTSDTLVLNGWKNSLEPKLNGLPLKLARNEASSALAIAADGNSFVIGTSWYLRRFDSQGQLLWAVPSPGATAAVNLSGNGSVVLAAYLDGTIRWYRVSDGKELLAFFPHADRKRWVLWTPSGYYDASAGGEELIGWQVNNGKDQSADLLPAASFRAGFYRPDVVARVLGTLDEAEALRLANEETGSRQEGASKPRLFVLAAGVSAYQDPDLALRYAAKDAEDLAAALFRQKGLAYSDVQTRVLTDAQATRDGIIEGMDWLNREAAAGDLAVVFLAGHGLNDPWGIFYYLPQNADAEKLKGTGLSLADIRNAVAPMAGKVLLFLDTCHSGSVTSTGIAASGLDRADGPSGAPNGPRVFASSAAGQTSQEEDRWGNGAFTKALVEGINGKADYGGNGRITMSMLELYLSERVKQLTLGQQTPTSSRASATPDFLVAVTR